MDRIILHIDVNNAFLSWTAIDLLNKGYKYDIRNSYAVIGGDESKRSGIVLAKSSSSKRLGIITGETLYSARKKCKVLKVYEPNYPFYQEMSHKLFELLYKYTDEIEIFSIDECFFDYTSIKHIYHDEVEFANNLKKEIKDTLGFTVNIGIANNKLCAKMASDFKKPNRVHTLYDFEIKDKMFPLPIEDLFGIGKKTAPKLRKLGINTIGDLANYSKVKLTEYFKNQACKMVDMANGIDDSIVKKEKDDISSISNSTTLIHDVNNKIEIYHVLSKLSDNVGMTLRKQNKYTNVVAVQLKDNYFKSVTHQKKLPNATNITEEIFKAAKELLDEMWNDSEIRLVGIRLDNLTDKVSHQFSLFEEVNDKKNNIQLENTIDKLKQKYGRSIIQNASLNDKSKKYLK